MIPKIRQTGGYEPFEWNSAWEAAEELWPCFRAIHFSSFLATLTISIQLPLSPYLSFDTTEILSLNPEGRR